MTQPKKPKETKAAREAKSMADWRAWVDDARIRRLEREVLRAGVAWAEVWTGVPVVRLRQDRALYLALAKLEKARRGQK